LPTKDRRLKAAARASIHPDVPLLFAFVQQARPAGAPVEVRFDSGWGDVYAVKLSLLDPDVSTLREFYDQLLTAWLESGALHLPRALGRELVLSAKDSTMSRHLERRRKGFTTPCEVRLIASDPFGHPDRELMSGDPVALEYLVSYNGLCVLARKCDAALEHVFPRRADLRLCPSPCEMPLFLAEHGRQRYCSACLSRSASSHAEYMRGWRRSPQVKGRRLS
jgi:hypothetical protein